MELIAFLGIASVVVLAVRVVSRFQKGRDAVWAGAAERLGLGFQGRSLFRGRAIRGARGVVRVELKEQNSQNQNLRVWRLSYPSTPFSMVLTMETPGKKLLKAFGAEDFEVGEPAFDSKFMVSGSDADGIRRYLTADRRAALIAAAGLMAGLKVTNTDITWRTKDRYAQAEPLLRDAGRLLALAKSLAGESQPAPQPAHPATPPPPLPPPALPPRPVARDTDPWSAAHDLPPGVGPDPDPVVPVVPLDGAPVPVEPEPVATSLVRLEDIIDEVLATRRLSFEATQIVEEKYAGQLLMVTGPVRIARRVDRDFDFRDEGPGMRIEAVVGEVTGTRVGAGAVIGIAHLRGGASGPTRGDDVTITGTILKVEPLRRAIYLTDAHLS